MKKKILLSFMLACIFAVGVLNVFASDHVHVSTIEELQSAHPYENNMDKTWYYSYPNIADSIDITFSDDTETESDHDIIRIFDDVNCDVGRYSGTSLAGKTVTVPGYQGICTVGITLTSDASVTKNGFTVTNITAKAEALSGACGDNLTYDLDPVDKILTINGTGTMKEYSNVDEAPWLRYNQGINKVQINTGVTNIADYAFIGFSELTSVTIPNTVTNIGYRAFDSCNKLTSIYYNGTEEQWKKIIINSTGNYCLNNATMIYFAYINLLDKYGNEISSKTQNMGETIDTSAITLPEGSILKLYRDKDLTQEYSLDTPISENLTLYADIIEINKLKISGAEKADIGQQGVTYSVSFATDKSAAYLNAAIEYPETLILKNIESTDFDINSETIDGITYLYCTYKSGNMPTNKTLHAFDLIFDISESAKPNDTLTIKFAGDDTYLAGSDGNTYDFDELGSTQVKINPILVKSISISGEDEIDKATKYTAVILPENATNKEIEWTADNDGIASISADGVLTPIKSGTVKITATAKDGSGIFAEKSVNVKVYARISSLASNIGVWDKDFAAGETEYVIYVPKDATAIKLTATHNDIGGKLTSGAKTLFSGKQVIFSLSGDETVISMTYTATGYTDGTYTVKVKKFEGTRTNVSSDGKSFEIKPTNIASGNTVILALYDGESLIETKYEVYGGADISFTTDKTYTGAAVMVWDDLGNMKPVCDAEIVK